MDFSKQERAVLECYQDKGKIAGGLKAGYQLRTQAIRVMTSNQSGVDVDGALASLMEKGIVGLNESGDRYYLTEEGLESVTS